MNKQEDVWKTTSVVYNCDTTVGVKDQIIRKILQKEECGSDNQVYYNGAESYIKQSYGTCFLISYSSFPSDFIFSIRAV